MEKDDLFDITALESHVLKFNWTKYISIEYGKTDSRRSDNEYFSSEFSISKMCHVKWKIRCKVISNNDGTACFIIGLYRIDSEQCEVNVLFSVKLVISGSGIVLEVPMYESFEFNFSIIRIKCTKPMKMEILPKTRVYEQYQTDRHIYITGTIITQNCCKERKEDDESINIFQLQHDFKSFFKSKQLADVTLNVRNESLLAHKFVLGARSPFFRRMFSQEFTEKQHNSVQIDDIEKSVMDAFLTFLYTGVIEDREFNTIFELYSVADKYEVTSLFKTCRKILISHISVNTVSSVLKLADMHNDEKLKDLAVKYICHNFSKVGITDEWEELLNMHPRLASYTLIRVTKSIIK